MCDAGCREGIRRGRVVSWELNGQTGAQATSAKVPRKTRVATDTPARKTLKPPLVTGTPISRCYPHHIVAWSADRTQRLDARNGLCLAKTHDAAFDRHLITLDGDLRVALSKSIRDHFSSDAVRVNFQPYEGKRIELPHRSRRTHRC